MKKILFYFFMTFVVIWIAPIGLSAFLAFFYRDCPLRVTMHPSFPKQSVLRHIGTSYAVSQWSRKYGTSCTTCHTVFPRLNYFGEIFMRNGYQYKGPQGPDGGTHKKENYGDLDLPSVGDWLGARVSLTAIEHETKGLTLDGDKRPLWSIGKANWLQLFTAGSITRNISIYDELEFGAVENSDEFEVKHAWFRMGFHNLFNSEGLVNFRVGKLSPKDFSSFSNRLRIFAEIPALPDRIEPSGGEGEEAISLSAPTNGIDYYGYAGPFLWSLGAGSPTSENRNQYLNTWASIRTEVTGLGEPLEGSSVSLLYYRGVDTKQTEIDQKVNRYFRLEPATNLRYKGLDLILSYLYGKEKNYRFNGQEVPFHGFTAIAAYKFNNWFMPGVQFDSISQENESDLEKRRVAGRLSFQPKENVNIVVTGDWDVLPDSTNRNHRYLLNLRTMF